MAEAIVIDANISTDYKSLIITDQTDWSTITGTIDSLTSIVLNFYTTTTSAYDYTYTFSSAEVDTYVASEEITITFEDLFDSEYAEDNGYQVQMVANSEDYISNYAFFGSDAYITTKVFENVNNLYTPEPYRNTIEPLALQVIFLSSMKYLDNSTINDRSVKWLKRLNILNRLNS